MVGARSGVTNMSGEWSRERELLMGVASGVAKRGSKMWVANVGCECESQNGVAKIKKFGVYVIGILKGVFN